MSSTERVSDPHLDNRRLRAALEALLDELVDVPGVDTSPIRDLMPPPPGERDPIEPPWVREGYASKEAWLADGGGE